MYEPVDFDLYRQGASSAFGKSVSPYFRLDAAKVIVSLDCDFLGSEQEACRYIRDFARGRRLTKPTDSMNRLYAVESLFTLTGASADHRLRLPSSQVFKVAAQLASKVLAGVGTGAAPGDVS